MKADIEALKRIAEAATAGPWVVWSSLYEGMAAAVVHDVEPLETVAEFRAYRNAVFLAAFDPPTCLALLSELASLRSEREGMREGLKPFAAVAESDIGVDEADDDLFRQASREYARAPRITVGDFRRARALLHQGETP